MYHHHFTHVFLTLVLLLWSKQKIVTSQVKTKKLYVKKPSVCQSFFLGISGPPPSVRSSPAAVSPAWICSACCHPWILTWKLCRSIWTGSSHPQWSLHLLLVQGNSAFRQPRQVATPCHPHSACKRSGSFDFSCLSFIPQSNWPGEESRVQPCVVVWATWTHNHIT